MMALRCPAFQMIVIRFLAGSLLFCCVTATACSQDAVEPGRVTDSARTGEPVHPMVKFLFATPTGYVLIAAYLFFVGVMVWLIIDMRSSNFMPADYVEKVDEMLRNKQLKEAFEYSKDEPSPFGKVMTAGIARLPSGLQEARDAAEFMLESAKARKESLIGYMAVLGTLGPLIGLVGTVSGMIETFAELGSGTSPNVGKLASGISHALNATLVGIFLSVLAIPVYTFFKNRLSRIVLDASLLADDLITQAHYAARKTDAPAGAAPAAAARAVPLPPKADGK
jgi:biopolymer transport protein ExbB